MNWSDVLHVSRYVLGAGLIVANVAVWYGVWLERDSAPKEIQERGWRILVIALVAEAAIGLFLYVADAGIDVMQRHEIAATYERAANAEREAGRLGADVNHLHDFVDKKEREISDQISGFEVFSTNEKQQVSAAITTLHKDEARLVKARNDAVTAATNAQADITKAEDALAKEAEIRNQIIAMNAPRTILPYRQGGFIQSVRPFAGLTVNIIMPAQSSADAGPLGDLLCDLLTKAGWHVGKGVPFAGWAKTVLVFIGGHASERTDAAARAIVLALGINGIQSVIETGDGPDIKMFGPADLLPNPDMTIVIGMKI